MKILGLELSAVDVIIIGVLFVFGFLPDPTDIFDAFLPALEWGTAMVYLLARKYGGLKT